jgi:hypothetical protein
MSADHENGTPEPVTTQSGGRYSHKSPGRAAFMKRLNQEGRGGMGGRKVTHGVRALVERLKRGLDEETPLAVLHAEYRGRYVADLGGEENCSAMELGVCDRLADLDLIRGLLNCQRDASKRMSLAQLEAFAGTVSKNCAAYLQAVKTVGPGRRTRDTDRTVIVRRWSGSEAPPPSTEQEHEQGVPS